MRVGLLDGKWYSGDAEQCILGKCQRRLVVGEQGTILHTNGYLSKSDSQKTLMPDWIRSVLSSRTLSLLVAIAYLVIACLAAPSAAKLVASLLIIGGALLLPLACIWFADELGEYVGVLPGPSINRRSPAWMVKIAGWILLLLPVILFLFTYPY